MKNKVILNKYSSDKTINAVGIVDYIGKNSSMKVLDLVNSFSLGDNEIIFIKCFSISSLNAVEAVIMECTDNYQVITVDDWVTCLDKGSAHGVDLNWAIDHIHNCT